MTLSMRQYTNESKWRVIVWYGQMASSAAGEDVEVLGQAMPHEGLPPLHGDEDAFAGGGYEAESMSAQDFPTRLVRRQLGHDVPRALARPAQQHDPPQDSDTAASTR